MTRDQILERYRHLRAISTPDPADRLHLAGEQTKKEAARGGLSFGNGARKGGAVRTAISLLDPDRRRLDQAGQKLDRRGERAGTPHRRAGCREALDYPDWQNGHPMAAAAPQIAP